MEVALPPADPDVVDAVTADSATDGGSPRLGLILSAIFAALIVACLAYLGVQWAKSDGNPVDRTRDVFGGSSASEDQAEREAAMSKASQFVLRLNTYGPEDLDENQKLSTYADRVRDVVSAKLAEAFETEGLPYAEATVSQAGYARTAQVFATGVESIDQDSASVLVAGAFRSSYPDSNSEGRVELAAQALRLQVKLVKVDGTWRVDDWTPLTGEAESDDELLTPVPDQTTAAPTTSPGDGTTTTGEKESP